MDYLKQFSYQKIYNQVSSFSFEAQITPIPPNAHRLHNTHVTLEEQALHYLMMVTWHSYYLQFTSMPWQFCGGHTGPDGVLDGLNLYGHHRQHGLLQTVELIVGELEETKT